MSPSTPRPRRILLTGGGTAGHIFPVLAVIEEIRHLSSERSESVDLLFVGRRRGGEQELIERAGVRFVGISAGKLRRYVDLQNLVDPLRVMLGFFQALGIMLSFWPDAVFVKGSYVSVPIIAAAWLLGRPVVAHETDAVLGLSNRFAAAVARTVCTAYPTGFYQSSTRGVHLVHTGNPVRAEFFTRGRLPEATRMATLLVVGGSQGSLALNRVIRRLIDEPIPALALLHVTGPNHYEQFAPFASGWYHPIASTDHLADLMKQADLILSRSGGTVFELAAVGRPAILVPLSTSANRHQELNARYFADHQAAVVIEEAELTADRLRSVVIALLNAPAKRRALARAIHRLAVSDAARRVAAIVFEIATAVRA